MNFSTLIKTLFLIIPTFVFAQQKNTINGKITSENKAIPDVAVELQINSISKFSISNKDGEYKFSDLTFADTDSLYIKVNFKGYKSFIQKIKSQQNIVFNINLIVADPLLLDEVVIKQDKKNIITARKASYKINQKDFIKNTKATEVLSTVPNVYYNKSDGKTLVEGKLEAKFFIDGEEIMDNEISNLDVADIDRIEVMSNPSSHYGTDFTGAVINIITKKKKEEFIKGSLGISEGLINRFQVFNPSLSYKRGVLTLKSNFRYLENYQRVTYSTNRIDENGTFDSSNISNSIGTQPSSNTRIKIDLSKKSNLSFSNQIGGYKFVSNANGQLSNNNSVPLYFSKSGELSNLNWNIGSVYNLNFTKNKAFYIKTYYSENDIKNSNVFSYSDLNSISFDIRSKLKEFSTNVNYEVEDIKIFKLNSGFYTDVKYINRIYSFSDTNFLINQNIYNFSAELDTEWTEKFSTDAAFTIENTTNSNATLNQNYSYILPTLNALYHFGNKFDGKFNYSRKILRPGAADLNDQVIVINPGVAKQGNSNLDPQIRNYYALTFTKDLKNATNLSLKFYNESINNSIEDVYRSEGDLVIQTLANAAKFSATGMNVGVRTKMFKKINTNLNCGFDYNVYQDNSPNSIIKKNQGYTFNGSLNLSTNLFKDKVSVSFSGRQNGPEFSLLAKRINQPYLDLTISTNFFKNKINLSLYGRGLLGNNANGFIDVSSYNNFYQKIETTNNYSNLLLTLTYNFGKKFDDKISNNDIDNTDIRK
jgi:hypothetical protein